MKKSKFSRGADRLRAAPGRGRHAGRRCLPAARGVARRRSTSGRRSTASSGVSELRELRQLRDENARLKRLVADLTLDKHILSEVLRKKV